MLSILETIYMGRNTSHLQNKNWWQMFNPMCTALQMRQNFIFQNLVCFERIDTPTQFLPCFMVIEPVVTKQSYYSDPTLSQEFQPMAAQLSMKAALPLAKILATASCRSSKTGPSSPYIPTTCCVWLVVFPLDSHDKGWQKLNLLTMACSRVAGMNAAAIGRTFDIPDRRVRRILDRYRANPTDVKGFVLYSPTPHWSCEPLVLWSIGPMTH